MDQKELGAKIRIFRTMRGVTQQQLELDIGASCGSISRIESGKTNPTKETLMKIGDILKLDEREKAGLFDIRISYEIPMGSYPIYGYEVLKSENKVYPIYGKNAKSHAIKKIELIATKDNLDSIHYFNPRSDHQIKCTSGFKKDQFWNKYFALHDHPTWRGNSNIGVCGNLHQIELPVNPISKINFPALTDGVLT